MGENPTWSTKWGKIQPGQPASMNAYSVTINGTNFLVEFGGEISRLGFFTTREVQAIGAEAAELAAIDAVRQSDALCQIVRNLPEDPPMMYVEDIVEIAAIDPLKSVPGLTWYSETDEPAEQDED